MAKDSTFNVSKDRDSEPVEIAVTEPEVLDEFVELGMVHEDNAEQNVCTLAFQSWRVNAQRVARDAMKNGEDPQEAVDNYVYGGPRRATTRTRISTVSADEAEEMGLDMSALEKLAAAGKIRLAE